MMLIPYLFRRKFQEASRDYIHLLQLEQDYELASLSHVLKNNDAREFERSKSRLSEIHLNLIALRSLCEEGAKC